VSPAVANNKQTMPKNLVALRREDGIRK
jgi:hypothetical protein